MERQNAIDYLNTLLEPGVMRRPRRLSDVLTMWKRYQADSVFRTKVRVWREVCVWRVCVCVCVCVLSQRCPDHVEALPGR